MGSTGTFDFETFLNALIHFNIQLPYYYIALYLQLMAISRLLFCYLEKPTAKYWQAFRVVILLVASIAVSLFTHYHSNIMGMYGGGGKLLGGSYLILFVLGMILQKYKVLDQKSPWVNVGMILLSGIFLLTFSRWECAAGYAFAATLPFGNSINPPNISQMMIALVLLALCAACYNLLDGKKIPLLGKICSGMEYVGKHSLYVFLYHLYFVHIVTTILQRYGLNISNVWISNLWNILLGISLPILWEYCLRYLYKAFL